MRPNRSAPWRTAWPSAGKCLAILGALIFWGSGRGPVYALDALEEPLSVAEEQTVPEQDVVGESVGEPAAEDAPVEGEPGPGDAVSVPPDELGEGVGAGGEVGPPVDGDGAADKPDE